MIDASSGYLKDGNKNRLRDMDIHQIVDVFNKRMEIAKYSRMVGVEEIEKNEFNLNIPRYIDSQQAEDIQDIEGHLKGGIPSTDVDALQSYWDVCPQLRATLFKTNRPGYLDLAVEKLAIKSAIYEHPEFVSFIDSMNALYADWQQRSTETLKGLQTDCHPKTIIRDLAEDLLSHYTEKPLIDNYDVYQHLMDYWATTMQDDCYLIAADGWKAETYRIIEVKKNKEGKTVKETDKGWTCDLVPKSLIVDRYFAQQQMVIRELEADLEGVNAQITELEEEHGGEEGAFSELDKINKANITTRLKEMKSMEGQMSREAGMPGATQGDKTAKEEAAALNAWLELNEEVADLKKALRIAEITLDELAYAKYPTLTEAEIKTLVVKDKWLSALDAAIHCEMDRISQALTQRVKELAERYETPMPKLTEEVANLSKKVDAHLQKMGFQL
jgi:type I restriction enzyme M protein